jgi:hypothetical protein
MMTIVVLGGVDLTPRYHTIDLGGVQVQRVHFHDGEKQFAVTINPEVEIQRVQNGAVFCFKPFSMADMILRQSGISPAVPFSVENLPDYRRAAREQLGAAAEIVSEGEPEFDVLPIHGWKSCRFNFTTRHAGYQVKTDVTFLNLSADQQIVIVTSSKEKDFPEVQVRAHKIMSRWHEVLPGDELGQN